MFDTQYLWKEHDAILESIASYDILSFNSTDLPYILKYYDKRQKIKATNIQYMKIDYSNNIIIRAHALQGVNPGNLVERTVSYLQRKILARTKDIFGTTFYYNAVQNIKTILNRIDSFWRGPTNVAELIYIADRYIIGKDKFNDLIISTIKDENLFDKHKLDLPVKSLSYLQIVTSRIFENISDTNYIKISNSVILSTLKATYDTLIHTPDQEKDSIYQFLYNAEKLFDVRRYYYNLFYNMEQLLFQKFPITLKRLNTLPEIQKQAKFVDHILYNDCKGLTAFCINISKLGHDNTRHPEYPSHFFLQIHNHIISQGWKPLNSLGTENFANANSMNMYLDYRSIHLDELIKNSLKGYSKERFMSQELFLESLVKYCQLVIKTGFKSNLIPLYIINEFSQCYLLGLLLVREYVCQ